ncbi:MAG TPA: hypothetical protein VMU73_02795 [Gaiellaceae bacterium]|nr:hypothetical protein [Gaiellaceae bacterium]
MPAAFVQEFKIKGDDRSTTNYDAVSERVDAANNRPSGLIVHTAGWDEEAGVFRIFDVWETRAQYEQFMRDRLLPAMEQGPADPENAAGPDWQASYELHGVIRG